jgi:cation:H+ antiporter
MDAIMIVSGLVLLLGGGEGLVRGGVAFATRMRLPMAVVGAVVLGFGTSMPELLTSLSAAWAGAPGIAVGNVVGSNIANILLILGISAVIAVVPGNATAPEDRLWLLAATVAALGHAEPRAPCSAGLRGDPAGRTRALHLAALSQEGAAEPVPEDRGHGGLADRGLILVGLGALMAGAWLLVTGATGSRGTSASARR